MKRKKQIAVLIILIIVFASWHCGYDTAEAKPVQNPEKLTIQFHYFRPDGNYQGWSLWLWKDDEAGTQYDFSEEPESVTGVVAKVTLSDVTEESRIGFLVKLNDWEQKDVSEDRYVELSEAKAGKLDVYLQSGDPVIRYSEEEAKPKSRIVYAKWSAMDLITFQIQLVPGDTWEEKDFSIKKGDGTRLTGETDSVKVEDGVVTGYYRLKEKMQMYTEYICSVNGMEDMFVTWGSVFDSKEFEKKYTYDGDDLGAAIGQDQVSFCVWAPTATEVSVVIYPDGKDSSRENTIPMTMGEHGEWRAFADQKVIGKYYTYEVTVNQETNEAVDPYAKSTGVNGKRGMILDLSSTDPEGYSNDQMPETESSTDDIIYEMSVRDFTVSDTSGVKNKGKYLGLTETGTVNSQGDSTGLDYLKELGITYVHLMPTQDFEGIDEETGEGYNWGYNPMNFQVPEGSYATDAHNGEIRVIEYKEMVLALHDAGIRVVMDVVFNHTFQSQDSNLNRIVPYYYYRYTRDGEFSNGSGCGNEVATQRKMARKLIVDSVCYWVNEYHVDGFRFDLMGLIDVETMRSVQDSLSKINLDIIIYGEGWTAGDTVYKGKKAESANAALLPGIRFFNNVYRYGIQGYISDDMGKNNDNYLWVQFGVTGAGPYKELSKLTGKWTSCPKQSIQYSTCHDGYTLYDLIRTRCQYGNEEEWKKRNQMAIAMVMTGTGTPFFQSGEEFLRSKTGADGSFYSNSYAAGDEINALNWEQRSEEKDMVEYYKKWIRLRKKTTAFTMQSSSECEKKLTFLESDSSRVIGYRITQTYAGLIKKHTIAAYNPTPEEKKVTSGWKKIKVDAMSVTLCETRELTIGAYIGIVVILLCVLIQIRIQRRKRRKRA